MYLFIYFILFLLCVHVYLKLRTHLMSNLIIIVEIESSKWI